jgi:hypothetical protein
VKKTPQHGHLRFAIRFVIDRQPPPVNASIPEEKVLRKKKRTEKKTLHGVFRKKIQGRQHFHAAIFM